MLVGDARRNSKHVNDFGLFLEALLLPDQVLCGAADLEGWYSPEGRLATECVVLLDRMHDPRS